MLQPASFDEIYQEAFKRGYYAAMNVLHKEDFPNWREQLNYQDYLDFKKQFLEQNK